MAQGRKRTIAGWGLIALSGMLGLAMLASRTHDFFAAHRSGCFGSCSNGVLLVGIEWGPSRMFGTSFSAVRLSDPHLTWWLVANPRRKGSTTFGLILFESISRPGAFEQRAVSVPLWPLILTSLAAGGLLRRSGVKARTRASANLCPACRYDRTGLGPDQACPECGQSPTPAPPAAS